MLLPSFFLKNHIRNLYEERLASYRKTFESHREVYCQNPLAQKLLTLQAEKEEIESRIKACDDEITVKQKELDHLTGNRVFGSLLSEFFFYTPPYIPELFLYQAKDSSTTEDLQQRYFINILDENLFYIIIYFFKRTL